MVNIFREIEDELFFNEEIIFDEEKIKRFILDFIVNEINTKQDKEKPLFFEKIIYDFFEYRSINLIKTKKTRDSGLDGIIKLKLELLGDITLGLQIKYKLIDSNDVDLFLASLKNAELQLGVIVCKDARKFEKYELNSKIKTILLSKGIKIKERLISEKIDINPLLILKLDEIISIIADEIRAVVKGVYKK
jgi:hypothetical protein